MSVDTDRIKSIEQHAEEHAYILASGLRKISDLELELENLKKILSGDVNETTKRAITLRDAVETSGMITRRQAQSILGNCHHNIATRAMEQAAEMFNLIFVKNGQGRWVLAAK